MKRGLSKCMPSIEPLCNLCRIEDEMELHCLQNCVITRLIIYDISGLGEIVASIYHNIGDVVLASLQQLPFMEHGLLMTICWAICNARNRSLFEGKACDHHQTMAYVHKLMAELRVEDRVGRWSRLSFSVAWGGLC